MSNIQINSYNIIPIPKLFNSDLTTTDYWVFNDPSMGSIDTPSTEINFDSRSDGTNNWYGIDLEQAGIFGAGNLSQTDFDCRWNQLSNTTGQYAGGDTLTLSNFTDSSYSTVSGTSVTTGTAVTNAMAEHMRYWKMGNYVGGAGGTSFPIDLQAPFSFYNGIRP